MARAYAFKGDDCQHFSVLGTDIGVLAGGKTGATFSLMVMHLPAGDGPPPHVHDDEDEAFYVLSGRMRFKGGDQEWVLGPGGFVYLPRGIVHRPMVEGNEPASVIAALSKTGLDDFFADLTTELSRSGVHPSLELLDKVGASYGLHHFAADP